MENGQIQKDFVATFKELSGRYSKFTVWSDFVTMAACAISNACDGRFFKEREELYMKCVERYNAEEAEKIATLLSLTTLALENEPEQDFLGDIFGRLELNNEWRGQFFTPYHIGKAMADMNLTGIEEKAKKERVSISDPCCGAGCLLIACANAARNRKINYQDNLIFVAQDIDYIAAMMCYIQLSLLGCQAVIKVGDSLADPFTDNEPSTDKLWYTPMYVLKNTIPILDMLLQNDNVLENAEISA